MPTIEIELERIQKSFTKDPKHAGKVLDQLEDYRASGSSDWRKTEDPERIRNRLQRLGNSAGARAMIEGASAGFDPLERIIGASELTGITFFERGILAARSIARVRIKDGSGAPVGFGSGVMISPQLFLTNNHVLPDSWIAASSEIELGYLASMSGPRDPQVYDLEPGSFFVTDEQLDMTIVAVAPVNLTGALIKRRGWCPLIAGSGKAIAGERVNIIQHPGGERMQVAVRDNTIVGFTDDFLTYTTDTKPGSSGSPVFNDQWDMAALHHAGVPRRNANGDLLMKNGMPFIHGVNDADEIEWIGNEGIRISRIVEHVERLGLVSEKRTMWERAFVAPELFDLWAHIDIAFEGPPASETASGTSHGPFTQGTNENGDPCWYFKLSFGPVHGMTVAAPRDKVATKATHKQPAPSLMTRGQLRARAEQMREAFTHTGPYYDEAEDNAARDHYWEGVPLSKSASEVFTALGPHLDRTHTSRLSYSVARLQYLYPAVDLQPDGGLRSLYSDDRIDPTEAIADELEKLARVAERRGMEVTGTTGLEAAILNETLWREVERTSATVPFNCEHVVPQSWFEKEPVARADLHHLFACEPACNSFRSNIPYWQFPPETEATREKCGRREGDNSLNRRREKVLRRAPQCFSSCGFPARSVTATRPMKCQRIASKRCFWPGTRPIRWANTNVTETG